MIFKDIWLDIKAVQERDPAARNALEVFLLYQGVHALIWHRFAHWFYQHKMFFVARLISQIARFFTLIEIHPGAQLGHGINVMGGAGAKILGAFEVGDNCSIAANAVLLKPLEDNVTAVGIPARPVKKDGVTIPKNKRSLTLEEYEDMRNRMEQMEQEIAYLKQALAARGTEVPSRKDAGQGIQDKETQEKPYQS